MTMNINTFFYSIQQGLKNIRRNRMFSIASMATMAACIFMFVTFVNLKSFPNKKVFKKYFIDDCVLQLYV